MSVKKVTFEEEDFLQFEAENYDKLTNNYDDRKKNSSTRSKNQKFRATTNEDKGFNIMNTSVLSLYYGFITSAYSKRNIDSIISS